MEQQKPKTGISQKAIVLNKEGKLLAVKRTESAPTNANKWDFPGGDLNKNEDKIEGLKREVREETKIEMEDIELIDVVVEWFENGNWITLGYVAKAKSENVVLSYEHNDYKWVTPEEFLELDASNKLKIFVKTYVEKLRS